MTELCRSSMQSLGNLALQQALLTTRQNKALCIEILPAKLRSFPACPVTAELSTLNLLIDAQQWAAANQVNQGRSISTGMGHIPTLLRTTPAKPGGSTVTAGRAVWKQFFAMRTLKASAKGKRGGPAGAAEAHCPSTEIKNRI